MKRIIKRVGKEIKSTKWIARIVLFGYGEYGYVMHRIDNPIYTTDSGIDFFTNFDTAKKWATLHLREIETRRM